MWAFDAAHWKPIAYSNNFKVTFKSMSTPKSTSMQTSPPTSEPAATDGITGKMQKIRSFMGRKGRLSFGQHQAVSKHYNKYVIEFSESELNFAEIFQSNPSAPIVMEIGFGMGDSLLEACKKFPQFNFLGIEVYNPGVANLVKNLESAKLNNCKIIKHDAVEVLNAMVPNHSLGHILIFFPDPWPKSRHHKRRLIQTEFLNLLAGKMAKGAQIDLATDWQPYAEHMMETLTQNDAFQNVCKAQQFSSRSTMRMPSKFEKKGVEAGRQIWDISFTAK